MNISDDMNAALAHIARAEGHMAIAHNGRRPPPQHMNVTVAIRFVNCAVRRLRHAQRQLEKGLDVTA